jgi:hypothetical protein
MAQSRARFPNNVLQKIRNQIRLASHEQLARPDAPIAIFRPQGLTPGRRAREISLALKLA